ncbi:helix-turn-helix transcriptional regulator [Lysinibacillus capsici]|uniref:helix-turn-helix transcriptional regulator n=1 Tax=Lysinibacillus capsici TaxID=2115968 RepID=UPI00289C0EB4|nr:helix-turn-helix transcriptional regulator [Lysinibacillus capsici]
MKYAELLQSYIEQSRLTLDEISEKISEKGLSASKQYLSKLQNGKTPPASEKLNSVLAEILDGDADKLDFFAYVEKAPDLAKSILSNFDEDLIDSYIALSNKFPNRTIHLLGDNDLDIAESEEFKKINQFAEKTIDSYFRNGKSAIINEQTFEYLKREFGHHSFFKEYEDKIQKHINQFGFNSAVSFILSLQNSISRDSEIDYSEMIEDPELILWYKELPLSGEKKLRKLRAIWEMMQDDDNE